MATITKGNITFNNVKENNSTIEKYGAGTHPIILRNFQGVNNSDTAKPLGGVVNAVDIDWNAVDLGVVGDITLGTINTTGDLLNLFKMLAEYNSASPQATTFYTYIGTDEYGYIVSDINNNAVLNTNASQGIMSIPGVKISTTMPNSLNDAYPQETLIYEGINKNLIIVGLASLFNKSIYLTNESGMKIIMDNLDGGTFNIGEYAYKVMISRGPISKAYVNLS